MARKDQARKGKTRKGMASEAMAPGKAAKAAKPAGGRTAGYVQGMVAGAAAVLSPPTGLLLGVLLAPGLIAIMVDQRAGKPVARTVLLFGMAATVSPVRSLWQLDHSMPVAVALLGQPPVLAVSWMAAAFGWLLTELVPLVIGLSVSLRLRDQQTKLQRRRKALEKEWDLPAAPGVPDPVIAETPAMAAAAPR